MALIERLLWLVLILALFSGTGYAERLQRPVTDARYVRIETITGSICSGFVIDHNVVATAAHCVPEIGPMLVRFTGLPTGDVEGFTVAWEGITNSSADIALLVGNTHGIEPLPFSTFLPRHNDEVFFVSNKRGPYRIDGTFDYSKLELLWPMLKINATVEHGDSGSPLLNAGNEVIGVVFALGLREPNTGFISSVSLLRNALAKIHELNLVPQ